MVSVGGNTLNSGIIPSETLAGPILDEHSQPSQLWVRELPVHTLRVHFAHIKIHLKGHFQFKL